MSSFKVFDIAGSGMSAQSVRLNTTASNLANAESVGTDPAQVYKARHPIFEAVRAGLTNQSGMASASTSANASASAAGVRIRGIVENNSAPSARYEPGNPLANEQGYVYAPNVNVIEEMTDMISASRAYQNNVEIMNTAKEMMLSTLKLGA